MPQVTQVPQPTRSWQAACSPYRDRMMYSTRDRMIPFQVDPAISGLPPRRRDCATLPGRPSEVSRPSTIAKLAWSQGSPSAPPQGTSRVATVSKRSGPLWLSQVEAPSGVAGSTGPCLQLG